MQTEIKEYKVYVFTPTLLSKSPILKHCQTYFDKIKRTVEILYFDHQTLNKGINDKEVQKNLKKVVDALFQTISNEKTFVFLQSNRLNDYYYEQNAFGQAVHKRWEINQQSEKAMNGQRILLFDAQVAYQNPYNLQNQSWKLFNEVFCNYWYGKKATDDYYKTNNYFGVGSPKLIHAFLSFSIEPIPFTPQIYVIATKQQLEKAEAQRQRLQLVLQINKITLQPLKVEMKEILSLLQIETISGAITEAFTRPNKFVTFIRTDVRYQPSEKTLFTNNPQFVKKIDQQMPNNWRGFFLSQQQVQELKINQKLVATSFGFINQFLKRYKEWAKLLQSHQKDVVDFTYIDEFNSGSLTRVLQRGYVAAYVEEHPQLKKIK